MDGRGFDLVFLDHGFGVRFDLLPVQHPIFKKLIQAFQSQVFRHAHLADHPGVAIFGDAPNPGLRDGLRIHVGDIQIAQAELCPIPVLSTPESTLASSAWPLPDTPASPRISPSQTSREISLNASRPFLSLAVIFSNFEQWFAPAGFAIALDPESLPPDHHAGQRALGRILFIRPCRCICHPAGR